MHHTRRAHLDPHNALRRRARQGLQRAGLAGVPRFPHPVRLGSPRRAAGAEHHLGKHALSIYKHKKTRALEGIMKEWKCKKSSTDDSRVR